MRVESRERSAQGSLISMFTMPNHGSLLLLNMHIPLYQVVRSSRGSQDQVQIPWVKETLETYRIFINICFIYKYTSWITSVNAIWHSLQTRDSQRAICATFKFLPGLLGSLSFLALCLCPNSQLPSFFYSPLCKHLLPAISSQHWCAFNAISHLTTPVVV